MRTKKAGATIDHPQVGDPWEEGRLGNDISHAKPVGPEESAAVDEAAGLQMISIRLQRQLIEDLKQIASYEGLIGYQPLIRRVLVRFVDFEKRRLLSERAAETRKARLEREKVQVPLAPPARQRKVVSA